MNVDYCIISSNCISGFWYRDFIKTEYEVPFIWSNIKLSNFIFLIKNFKELDFTNIKIIDSVGEFRNNEGEKHLKILIDDKVSIYFTHYKENKGIEKPIIENITIFHPNIKKYAEETWHRRVSRMSLTKKIVWVFWDDEPSLDCNIIDYIDLAQTKKDDIFILITNKTNLISKSNNMHILKKKSYKPSEHLDDINKILNS